jgi:hypothetical protein
MGRDAFEDETSEDGVMKLKLMWALLKISGQEFVLLYACVVCAHIRKFYTAETFSERKQSVPNCSE